MSIQSIIAFFKSIFFPISQPNEITHVPFSAPVLPISNEVPKQSKPKQKRIQRAKSMRDLLDNIEATFDSVNCPTDWKWSHIQKDTATGLRKLGPHIFGGKFKVGEKIIGTDDKLSSFMFCAFDKEEAHDSVMNCVFCYAVKLEKSPWRVEQKKGGVIYECGGAWRNKSDKLLWGNWYVSVNQSTKEVTILSILHYVPSAIGYTQKVWRKTPMLEANFVHKECNPTDILKELFVTVVSGWNLMDTQWKVCVTRKGQRVTWSIPFSETKNYFSDREPIEIDQNGKKKKIIHFVRQHTRNLASGKVSNVREHIRGINKFSWKGFDVLVVAPKFHRNAIDFDIASTDENDVDDDKNFMYGSKVGRELTKFEERSLRKELPALH